VGLVSGVVTGSAMTQILQNGGLGEWAVIGARGNSESVTHGLQSRGWGLVSGLKRVPGTPVTHKLQNRGQVWLADLKSGQKKTCVDSEWRYCSDGRAGQVSSEKELCR
jgi:hypothetical protein